MKTAILFKFERETKGAVRYQEIDKDGKVLTTSDAECLIGTIYLRKLAIAGPHPEALTVTIESIPV